VLARALGQGRLGWLLGLSLLALASYGLKAVMGFGVGSTLQLAGSPGGMVALLLGLLLDGVLWLLGLKLAVEALMRALAGPVDSPHREEIVADGLALRHLLLWFGLLVAGWVLWHVMGARTALLAALAFACVLPAVLSLLTLEGSLLRAFDPRAWIEMLRRAGPAYAVGAARISGLLLAGLLLAAALAALLPGWLAAAPVRFLQLAALVLAYHALGEWLHQQRAAFDLATPAPLPRARLGSFDEDAAMQEADALASADPPDPAAAAARLLPVLRGRGGSAPVHARYRELLQAAGDRDGLLAHDREYVATLLALGQERQALALYLSARALDPRFELQEPEELGRLAELTERLGQAQLAAALALEYARRFPRTRGALAQGLRAVRLLAAAPGRHAELRALLEDLLPRHPGHALRSEVERALAGLPRG
jgi:hypothetical protein